MENKKFEVSSKVLIIYLLLFIFIIILIVPKEAIEKPTIIGKVVASVRILSSNAPTFDNNIDDYTIYQDDSFFFDVNCSDIDIDDVITYSDNFTGFEINSTTGIINQTATGNSTLVFNQSFVVSNNIKITCSDNYGYSASDTFVLEILDVNEAPLLSYIGPQIAVENELFTLDIDATDPENNTLIYNSSTTLFTINNETGLINFTPILSQVGNYTINITVFDGGLYDNEVISFRIVRGPYCGDDSCGSTESCSSCSQDCGACSSLTAPESGEASSESGTTSSGGGVSTESGGAARAPYYMCDEKWECSDWSECSLNGIKTRKCKEINNCGTKQNKPSEIAECVYQPTCFDGIQNGGETGIDCGGPCEPCLTPNCFDGIKNQNETGIDCGGPCEPCEIKKFAKIPSIEILGIFKIPRQLPWALIIIIAIVLTLTVAGDQVYVARINKKEFDEYRESIGKYRIKRRKIYKFVLNTTAITLISSVYIYYFSNSMENMIRYSWVPIILIISTPLAVSAIIRHYTYYEYKKRKKEQRLKQTHKRELLQLIKIENELLFDMEVKSKNKIYDMAVKHKFDGHPALYNEINPLYGSLISLRKRREERINLLGVSSKILDKILDLTESETFIKASKDYPEFMSILKSLKYIKNNQDLDTTDEEEEFLEGVEDISMPHMKSVIMSNKKLVGLYNNLVDIYQLYTKKHERLRNIDAEIMNMERGFTDKIKGLSKKAAAMKTIQENPDFISMYNNVVDLFNHYVKKMELNKSIKEF